jgi:hypothetical protein
MVVIIHKLLVGSFTFLQCLSGTELLNLSGTPDIIAWNAISFYPLNVKQTNKSQRGPKEGRARQEKPSGEQKGNQRKVMKSKMKEDE